MRLFFAIELTDDVRERIANAQTELRGELGDESWRWTKPEMLHVTLAFLGDVPESSVEDVKARATAACELVSATSLAFGNVGCFPKWKSPKVLWMGAKEALGHLAGLGDQLSKECAGAGASEDKVLLHVTVARARTRGSNGGEVEKSFSERFLNCGSMKVNQIVLFESTAGQKGPVQHKPIATFGLKS